MPTAWGGFWFLWGRNQLGWSLIWDWCFFYCFVPLRLRYGGVFCTVFFSPSLVGESSPSLLLFKFIDIFIGSVVWLSFVVNDCFVAVIDADDHCFVLMVDVVVVAAVEILVTVVRSVDEFTLFSIVDAFFMGFFFSFFFFDYLGPSFVVFFC